MGRERPMETMIGKVIHYYPKIGVAAVVLDDYLENGDTIHIRGPHDDFSQTVSSMEIEHQPITEAMPGQDVGIKVSRKVHEGDVILKES